MAEFNPFLWLLIPVGGLFAYRVVVYAFKYYFLKPWKEFTWILAGMWIASGVAIYQMVVQAMETNRLIEQLNLY